MYKVQAVSRNYQNMNKMLKNASHSAKTIWTK